MDESERAPEMTEEQERERAREMQRSTGQGLAVAMWVSLGTLLVVAAVIWAIWRWTR